MDEIHYSTDISQVDWEEMRATLIADDFDNGRTPAQYRISFENSAICVIAYAEGRIIGTVRVLSDGVCNAYVVDVWTLSAYRKRGIARRMMDIASERLAGQHIYLFTDDSMAFYERLGFAPQGVGMARVVGDWLQNDTRDM